MCNAPTEYKEAPFMAEHQNFRTALAGFNREDVVRYIEYLNTTHAAEIAQLNSELEYLRSREMSAAEANITAEEAVEAEDQKLRETLIAGIDSEKSEERAEIEILEAELEEKTAEVELLKAEAETKASEIETLKAELQAKDEEVSALKALNQDLQNQQAANADLAEKELAVYRRAERVERKARERADLVYYRVNGTLSEATGKVEDAAKFIGEMTERVTAQLNELQAAVTGSKAALQDAAETMVSLRPAPEE